jgi:hypothetical protein
VCEKAVFTVPYVVPMPALLCFAFMEIQRFVEFFGFQSIFAFH